MAESLINKKIENITSKTKGGFTLLEMIIYVAIFAMILFIIIRLFWQVQFSEVDGRVARETKENAIQVTEIIKRFVRKADDLTIGSSTFGSHPGEIALEDTANVTIDTYTKNVTVGGESTSIRKLRLAEVGESTVDITSDHVDVTNFQLTNLTQGVNSDTILMDLTISSANPGGDDLYDHSFVVRTSVVIRQD